MFSPCCGAPHAPYIEQLPLVSSPIICTRNTVLCSAPSARPASRRRSTSCVLLVMSAVRSRATQALPCCPCRHFGWNPGHGTIDGLLKLLLEELIRSADKASSVIFHETPLCNTLFLWGAPQVNNGDTIISFPNMV